MVNLTLSEQLHKLANKARSEATKKEQYLLVNRATDLFNSHLGRIKLASQEGKYVYEIITPTTEMSKLVADIAHQKPYGFTTIDCGTCVRISWGKQ